MHFLSELHRSTPEQTVAFQRKKPAAIGTKANFPGFIEPALASAIDPYSPKREKQLSYLNRKRLTSRLRAS